MTRILTNNDCLMNNCTVVDEKAEENKLPFRYKTNGYDSILF